MPDMQVVGSIAAVVSAVGSIAVAAIAWWQLGALLKQTQLQGERERKWRTLEICSRMDSDPLLDAVTERIWNQSGGGRHYDDLLPVRREILTLLNYLDSIAVGIAQGFYVEDVARDHLEPIFVKAHREFLSESRAKSLEIELSNYDHVIRLTHGWRSGKITHRSGIH